MDMDNKTKEFPLSSYISERFAEILTQYNTERIAQERTEQQYLYVFNALCDHARCDFLDISAEQVKAFFLDTKETSTVKSTDFSLSVLRAVSRYMDQNAERFHIEPRYMTLFSAIEVIFPDFQYDPNALPDLSGIDRVLSYYKEAGDMAGFLACALVLRCSLTTTELVRLKRSMLIQDADGNYGIRKQPTAYSTRYIKIPDDIAELIRQYSKTRTDNQPDFFLNKKGKPVSARALQNRLSAACSASGVKAFTYNDLRILSQTIMIKDGAPLEKIAQHTDLKQTDWFFRYNRVVDALKESAVDYVNIKVVWNAGRTEKE